tara:strand:- start:580 stop:915 length:336 start_codon:yes stop_codon:yes gene_type:complete
MRHSSTGYKKQKFIESEMSKHAGKTLPGEKIAVAQSMILSKISQMEPEEGYDALVHVLNGVNVPAQEYDIPAYQLETKQGKQVTVTTTEAMDAILTNGGKFIGETVVKRTF